MKEIIEIILKCVFLFLGISYGFTCFGRLFRKEKIYSLQTFLMAIGIVGFIAVQFWL